MYSLHRRQHGQRGFAVGALLFALGLIGVVGGTMFSSTTQGVMLSIKMQNSVQDRTTGGNAIRQLAALSVLGTDGATLCPPRSSSVFGTACGAASDTPVMLQSLSALAPTDLHLPSGYDGVNTGSPVDIAVFAPAAGLPQTDSAGRYLIVCRWEQLNSDPAARAFAIIGAGRDGIVQTHCGDMAANGDDVFAPVTVALAAAHLDSWQLIGGKAQFGATGKHVTVDADGNIIATSLTASGAINGGAGQFSSIVSFGSLAAVSATLGDISAASLVASGSIYGTAGHFTSINDTGSLVAGASTLGAVSASSFATSGTLTAGTATLGNVSAASIGASGDINTAGMYRINGMQIAASNLANGTTGTGSIVLADSPTLSGTLTGTDATFSGTVTAASFAGGGVDLSGGGVTATGGASSFGAITVSSLTDTGNATISGILSGSSATFSGNVTAGSFTGSGAGLTSIPASAIVGLVNSQWITSGTDIYYDTGNVGIGTSVPSAALDVYGAINLYGQNGIIFPLDASGEVGASLAVGAGAMMFLLSEETSSAAANTAIGYGALATTISNSYNTAVGSQAGFMLQGDGNTFIGASSGSFGGASNNNTAIGARSLGMTMDASNNTAIGYMALGGFFSNGANNVALGYQAGADINSGSQNIVVGYFPTAGVGITSGSGNILIGNDVRPQSQTASNQLNIGNLIYGTGLGAAATVSTGSVGIGTASPVATLDIAGAVRLAPRTSAPSACSSTTKGSIAYASTAKRLCVCNGTSWIFDYNGAACTW